MATDLFDAYALVQNKRETVRICISAEGDAAFAVVDVDTLWQHKSNGSMMHWEGRDCKGYTKVHDHWLLVFHTGLLEY